MAKPKEQHEAMRLRKKGESIGSIAKTLSISKSTVSCWCKDITLSAKQIEKIARESKHHATKTLLQASEQQRHARQQTIKEQRALGAAMIDNLTERDILMIGLGLYWGEGYKKGSQEFGFTNSDPNMITFYLRWLRSCFGIEQDRLIFRVSINQAHQQREQEVLTFWQKKVNVPLSQFTKTSFIKAPIKKDGYNTKHYGTLRIKVRRGTNLRHKILGAIAELT